MDCQVELDAEEGSGIASDGVVHYETIIGEPDRLFYPGLLLCNAPVALKGYSVLNKAEVVSTGEEVPPKLDVAAQPVLVERRLWVEEVVLQDGPQVAVVGELAPYLVGNLLSKLVDAGNTLPPAFFLWGCRLRNLVVVLPAPRENVVVVDCFPLGGELEEGPTVSWFEDGVKVLVLDEDLVPAVEVDVPDEVSGFNVAVGLYDVLPDGPAEVREVNTAEDAVPVGVIALALRMNSLASRLSLTALLTISILLCM